MSDTHAAHMGADGPIHHVAHHFANADEEFEAAKQGMWIFLVTEVLMFGGLFVAYAVVRGLYPDMFHEAHHALSVKMGATNTVFLITSSLTMALAVSATQKGERGKAMAGLMATFLFACGFMVVKFFEYSAKFEHGLLPGAYFHSEHYTHPKTPLFFSLYFVMTGLHGFHVFVGMCLMVWLMIRTARKEFSPSFYTPVELVGFYWHFVDLVWIYLFPLMYLVG